MRGFCKLQQNLFTKKQLKTESFTRKRIPRLPKVTELRNHGILFVPAYFVKGHSIRQKHQALKAIWT